MARAAAPSSKSFGFLIGTWTVLSACLVVALATVAIERAAANEFKIANVDLVELAGPAGGPTGTTESPTPSASAAADLSRRLGSPVRYGATGWTVVNSRLISANSDLTDRPIVVTEVVVTNTHLTAATRVRAADVRLIFPDGSQQPVDRFEFIDDQRVFSLDPGESLLVILVFKPSIKTDPDLTQLTLSIGEEGRIPIQLPIVGEPEPVNFPRSGLINGPALSIPAPPGQVSATTIVPESVAAGLNADHYRASVGQQVILVEASVQSDDVASKQLYLDPSFWSMVVGGKSVAPLQVATPAIDRVALTFAVDVGPAEMALVGGANTGVPVEYGISFVPNDPTLQVD